MIAKQIRNIYFVKKVNHTKRNDFDDEFFDNLTVVKLKLKDKLKNLVADCRCKNKRRMKTSDGDFILEIGE